MKEVLDNISCNYTYIDSSEISNVTTIANLTGTSSYITGNIALSNTDSILVNDLCTITNGDNVSITSNGITTNTNEFFIAGSTGGNIQFVDPKKLLIENILDRVLELKSLTKQAFYEFFDIRKIDYRKNKTKIICSKDVDLNYISDLKNESQLLIESIDVPCDNYKEKAIKKDNNLSSIIYGEGIILTSGTNNTITINPSEFNLYNNYTNVVGANNYNNFITYTT